MAKNTRTELLGTQDCQCAPQASETFASEGKKMLHEIMYADTRAIAEDAVKTFERGFAVKHERAVSSLNQKRNGSLPSSTF